MEREFLEFVRDVKAAFSPTDDVDYKYSRFLSALNRFDNQLQSVEETVRVLTLLFEDHENLLSRFKKFFTSQFSNQDEGGAQQINRGFTVTHPKVLDSSQQQLVEEKCKAFLTHVKNRFPNNSQVYDDLESALVSYYDGELVKVSQVYRKISRLLLGHVDLVHEFESFLNQDDSESDRRTVGELRYLAKKHWLERFDGLLSDYRSATETLKERPEELTETHLRRIEGLYFSSKHDGDRKLKRAFRRQLMKNLSISPKRVHSVVKDLERMKRDLVKDRAEVEAFFDTILAHPVPPPCLQPLI